MKTLYRNSSTTLLQWMSFLLLIAIFWQSAVFCRIYTGLLFAICIILGKREKALINPYYLFSIAPLSLATYFSVGDYYMLELSVKTWILCIINIYAFIVGVYITGSYKQKKKNGSISNSSLKIHAIVLFLLSFVGVIIPSLVSVLSLLTIPAIVCAIKSKDKAIIAIVLLYVVGLASTGNISKMGVLLDLLTVVISYLKFIETRQIKATKAVVILTMSVVVMFYSFSFATKGDGMRDSEETYDYYSSRVEWNDKSASLFLPYMYLSTPWTNVEYVVNTQDKRTNGLWTLKPIMGYLMLDNDINWHDMLVPYSSFNVFTFITVHFKDFGYWLSIIPTLFLGFFVKKMYTRYVVSDSPFDVACYVTTATATVMMFFSNHFFMQSYPFTLFILMELYKLFNNKLGVSSHKFNFRR